MSLYEYRSKLGLADRISRIYDEPEPTGLDDLYDMMVEQELLPKKETVEITVGDAQEYPTVEALFIKSRQTGKAYAHTINIPRISGL